MDVTASTLSSIGPSARIRLARIVDVGQAAGILREALGWPAWSKGGEVRAVWFDEAFFLFHRDPGLVRAMAEDLVGRVSTLSVESMREHLFGAFELWKKASSTLVARGFEWIRGHGEAGDADAVAVLLCGWVEPGPSAPDELLPLAGITEWLLEHGGTALRASRHAVVLPLLVDVVRHHAPEHLELALRYVVRNEHGAHAWRPGWIEVIWRAIETALTHGVAPDHLLSDLLSIPGVSMALSASEFFAPFERDDLPHARACLARAIARCALPGPRMQDGWRRVVAALEPFPPGMLGLESLRGCAETLVDLARCEEAVPEAWAAFVGTELLRHTELRRSHGPMEHARERLENLASWPALQPGLRRSFARALRETVDPGLAGAREILSAHAAPAAVYAAVYALPRRSGLGTEARTDMDSALLELRALLHACGRRAVRLGLPRAVLGVDRVEAGELDDGYAVRVLGNTLRVRESDVCSILGGPDRSAGGIGLAAYVIHELIHVSQRIDDKRAILELKKAGETTLLHLDLSADHATALVIALAAPGWDVAAVKDLQGRSLADFPALRTHAPSAVERKSVRLVSLRADYLIRRHRAFGIGGRSGYVYADYPPGAGTLAVLANGSPQRVLDAGKLDGDAARVLGNAARPPTDIDGIDRILVRTLPTLAEVVRAK